MSNFILHKKQKAAIDLIKGDTQIAAYLGGIRSGKTITGSHFALDCILNRRTELGGIASNTNKQLTKATLKEFKQVLASYGLLENEHYLVNKSPDRLFRYRSKFTDHAGVWSFFNGAQIYTFSLETQIRGVEFGWVWLDEIQSASIDDLNVVLGRMSGSKNPKTFYTLTPPHSNPEIDELIYGENHLPLVVGTTYDNKHLPPNYIKTLEQTYDKYTFRREVLCERVTMAGLNWLYSFDRQRHVSDAAQYQPNQMVYVSFDFNVNPFVCTLSHRGVANGKRFIHYFDTVVLTPEDIQGKEYIEAIVEEIKRRTPAQARHNLYMITGDVSGRQKNVIGKVGESVWNKVIRTFNISVNQVKLPTHNPTHHDSRTLCNAIFTNYGDVLIHPKNKELIRDCEFAKAKPDGSLLKDSRAIETQQLDLLDAMRYDLNTWNADFILR